MSTWKKEIIGGIILIIVGSFLGTIGALFRIAGIVIFITGAYHYYKSRKEVVSKEDIKS